MAVVAVISALSITLLISTVNFNVTRAQDVSSSNNNMTATASSITVHAGGGNSTDMLSVFVPKDIQVSVGQSITWDNPSTVAEAHTATFVLDNNTDTDIVSPFAVPKSTQLTAIPPNSNNEPLTAPGQKNVVIAVNARSYIPTVIDSQGSVKEFAPPNAAYTMTILSNLKVEYKKDMFGLELTLINFYLHPRSISICNWGHVSWGKDTGGKKQRFFHNT
jgi:plastocyanin